MSGARIAQDFSISYEPDEGEQEWIRYVVYHTRAGMLDAIRRGHPEYESAGSELGVCTGITGTFRSTADRPRATVRLCRDALTRSLLLHETIHAVTQCYRWNGLLWTEGDPWGPDNHDFVNPLESMYALASSLIRWELSTHPHGIDAFGNDADEAVLKLWGESEES